MYYIQFVMRGINAAFNFFEYLLHVGGMWLPFVSVCGMYTTYRLFLSRFFDGGSVPND